MLSEEIRQFANELEIPYLLHFTFAENLPSILKHGIYPIARMSEFDITAKRNDQLRLDDRLDATCTSIAHPNDRMFFSCRMHDTSVEWVVLVLDRSILWNKQCAFHRHNAADPLSKLQPLKERMTIAAFKEMFNDINDNDELKSGEKLKSREEQNLKSYDPTDVQAEVMVLDVIEPNLIQKIVFNSEEAKDLYSHFLTKKQEACVHAKDQGFFSTRSYSRKYTSKSS